ncbi:MAG: isoprenyl transferase [Thermodesulfobacteriota bacterium]
MPALPRIDQDNLPAHIAIIMDGNGRWANRRGLMRLMGHKVGVDSVKVIVEAARKLGIRVLTLYAFSTENWRRPEAEVSGLMDLLRTFLLRELPSMMEHSIRLRVIGQAQRLPEGPRRVLEKVIAETSANTGLVLNLALSYGARDEILRATARLARRCMAGELAPEDIDEAALAGELDTAGLPDPDLLIRTGGEYRLSNFLLWQASYAELYITETPWPEFRKRELYLAIQTYQQRQRRFGRTGDQLAAS